MAKEERTPIQRFVDYYIKGKYHCESCPFCWGGEARIHTFELDGGYMSEVCCVSDHDIGCFASSRHWAEKEEWAKESAINAWNKRVFSKKHGKFEYDNKGNYDLRDVWVKCSECGYKTTTLYSQDMHYCPRCGSKNDSGCIIDSE